MDATLMLRTACALLALGALGGLGMAVSLLGAVATWNRGSAFGPHWYPVSLIVLAIPSAWLGGWLRVRQSQAKASA